MTRTTQEIESDLAAARAAYDSARATADATVAERDDLLRRATAGDPRITAAAVAKASAEANFVELPLPALLDAVRRSEAELRVADAEKLASDVLAALAPLEAAVEQRAADARAAVAAWVAAWAEHAQAVSAATSSLYDVAQRSSYAQAETPGSAGAEKLHDRIREHGGTPRVRRSGASILVDGRRLAAVPIFDPLSELVDSATTELRRFGARSEAGIGRRS